MYRVERLREGRFEVLQRCNTYKEAEEALRFFKDFYHFYNAFITR